MHRHTHTQVHKWKPICMSMLNTCRWHTQKCTRTHARWSWLSINTPRHFPFSPVLPETWATSFFLLSALIPYLLSAAATEVVFIFTHTHTHSVARISPHFCDWFHLQHITNEMGKVRDTLQHKYRMRALILRYFNDNHRGMGQRWLHRAPVPHLLLHDTKQEESAALSKLEEVKWVTRVWTFLLLLRC